MRKTKLIVIVSLLSLSIMGCGFLGFVQSNSATATPDPIADVALPSARLTQPVNEAPASAEQAPAPTVDPLIEAKSCLANTWEMNGLSDYVMAAVPPELAEEYNLQFQGTSGQAYFTLTPEGEFNLHAEELEFQFSAQVAVFEVPVTVRIDGIARGQYAIDNTTLTTSNTDTSGLTASAQAMGEDLMDPNQIINAIPLLNPPFNSAEYICQGSVLELQISGYPGNIPPLVFQAVK
jgi:hypothetical protein